MFARNDAAQKLICFGLVTVGCLEQIRFEVLIVWKRVLPLMTGVNTAMPLKLGSLTVLSRISPPMLGDQRSDIEIT